MRILCMRFPKPDGTFTYFIGASEKKMREEAPLFDGDPARGEIVDIDRLDAEWPPERDKDSFENGRRAALDGTPSYWLF